MSKPVDFAVIFKSSIKEGITSTLGGVVMDSLQNLLKQPLEAYSEKPSELHSDLSRIFGSAGVTLEKMITKELFQRLDLHYSSELEFETSINLARRDVMLNQRRERLR